jgi:hypothetical protein
MARLIDILSANETVDAHNVRAWSGVAVDEGVGLITIVEVSDASGRTLARFEEFLDAAVHRNDHSWQRDDAAAVRQLQERAMERARAAIAMGDLESLNGHRFDV